ncbi:MAG: aminodeoxychorismate synthase component I [Spirochaetia bacterium]|nr:aminodeoxychorismate synthase component I [Spirochaetia bacterium]
MLKEMNTLGAKKVPFFFIIDFEIKNPIIVPLEKINPDEILYKINEKNNYEKINQLDKPEKQKEKIILKKYPPAFTEYKKAFHKVIENQIAGNSYLLNLTFSTKIKINKSLKEIFLMSEAPYKLFFKDEFIVFSPESFVKIKDNIISSYPMKGTIDAKEPNAEQTIINDEKEYAEHVTIVDLIRNDLSIKAKNVKVEKFRYIDKIKTAEKELLQVSSKITGELENNYHKNLGNIFLSLLPAGSITGAPKKKTIEIIKETETHNRGFYTGVFGVFDGQNLDSAVIIRYIEKRENQYLYKSGGGITVYSEAKKEYKEMMDKIYVPIA